MKKFLILGLGRFGRSLALALTKHNAEVMVMDKKEENVQSIRDEVTYAVIGDCTEREALEKIGADNFDAVIVCMGEPLENSIMATVLLKELGAAKIIVKGQNEMHAKVLRMVGADKVILPEGDMGRRLAQLLTTDTFLDYMQLSPTHSIIEMAVPKDWIGKSIIELDVRKRFGINILAVKKQNGTIDAAPMAETVFTNEDILVVLGEKERLERL